MKTETTKLEVGMKVEIRLPDDHVLYTTAWWPKKGEFEKLTATVQKVFKNGKVMIAIDQFRNKSEDGKHSMRWSSVENLFPID
jgi:hypothetical protein